MIADPRTPRAETRRAVAEAARTLTVGDPRAHVFYEERSDVRLTLASSGLRDAFETRTRGAVISGRRAFHVSDPEFIAPSTTVGAGSAVHDAMAENERAILDAAAAAGKGRCHPNWSARLVSFHQVVWVGTHGDQVVSDLRGGTRVEFRAQVGSRGAGTAIGEFVLRPGAHDIANACLSKAFDRAEERSCETAAAPRGQTSAVFAPGVAGVVVHELVGHALEGDLIARRPTWLLRGTLPSAARQLSVVDDPRRGRGAWMVDDEGTEVVERLLIERGQWVDLMLDKASASALNRESTGHGRRSSYLEGILPRMGCTYVVSGDDDPAEVIRSTPSGVFIRRLAAGQTDPYAGKASFVVTDADRIVDGRLAEPLESFVIELDGIAMWGSIDRVANDLAFDTCIGSCVRDGQPLAVSVGAPTIRIGVVTVRT